ncbi:MAG: hypothetical protein H7Y17_03165 [Chlorobia bacterium]|nr:hypothetical protein [Fimbriimonadaceae bacterium]
MEKHKCVSCGQLLEAEHSLPLYIYLSPFLLLVFAFMGDSDTRVLKLVVLVAWAVWFLVWALMNKFKEVPEEQVLGSSQQA